MLETRRTCNESWMRRGKKMDQVRSIFILLLGISLLGCIKEAPKKRNRVFDSNNSTTVIVKDHHARILQQNPIVESGNANLAPNADLSPYVAVNEVFVTSNTTLQESCDSISSCFGVKQNKDSSFTAPVASKWGFHVSSPEFFEVNTFVHVKNGIKNFHELLLEGINDQAGYESAIPVNTFSSRSHFTPTQLITYSKCDVLDNAFYSPALNEICLGNLSEHTNILMAEDPSIVHHELGHTIQHVMLNTRNYNAGLNETVQLGYAAYDESGSLGEGIADYFSYVMEERTHFAEWGLGRFLSLSRPMSENEAIHIPGVDDRPDLRLKYPKFLNYEPNKYERKVEDIHNSGMIVSHFLVALTEKMKTNCSMDHKEASQAVLRTMTETFAYLGDLSGKGLNSSSSKLVNLGVAKHASTFFSTLNPVNFRRFMQTFSSFFLEIYNDSSTARCGGSIFSKTEYEQLVDEYGLLLFRTYNRDGNDATTGHALTVSGSRNDAVSIYNTSLRKYTPSLVTKDKLQIDARSGQPGYYVAEDPSSLRAIVETLVNTGRIAGLSKLIPSDLAYNDSSSNSGNGKIGKGEVVGIALNLFNNSNESLAGIQILGSDWDHVKWSSTSGGKLYRGSSCFNLDNTSLPASTIASVETSSVTGNCNYVTRDHGEEASEQLAPVCYIADDSGSSSVWVTQDVVKSRLDSFTNNCLDGSTTSPDCYVRVIKGADNAFFSQVLPQKNWFESLTYTDSDTGQAQGPQLSTANIILMEVNPNAPTGTKFRCLLRARFTNCENCFHDSTSANDDYLDYEYSGSKPYRLFMVDFTIDN
jgi:hypothetical protein